MPAFTALSYRFYGTRLTSYLNRLRKKLSTPTLSDVVPNPTVGLQAQDCRLRVKLAVGRILETMEEDCE
jgi:hypothetical protein